MAHCAIDGYNSDMVACAAGWQSFGKHAQVTFNYNLARLPRPHLGAGFKRVEQPRERMGTEERGGSNVDRWRYPF
jgi:hypothetical protein